MRAYIRSRLKVGSAGVAILSALFLTTAEARLDVANIKNLLAKEYPDYQLISKEEFADKILTKHTPVSSQEYFRKLPGFPTVAYGDFNHDNNPDFAAVLRGRKKHPPRGIGIYYYYDMLVVVCHGSSKSKYVCEIVEDKEKAILPFHRFLRALKTSKASSEDRTVCEKLIPPEKDYFALVPILGSASFPYYYVNGSYKVCHN